MLLCIQLNYFKDILWFTIWLQSFFCSTNFLFNTKKRWPCQHSTKTANPHLPRVAKVLPGPFVPVVNLNMTSFSSWIISNDWVFIWKDFDFSILSWHFGLPVSLNEVQTHFGCLNSFCGDGSLLCRSLTSILCLWPSCHWLWRLKECPLWSWYAPLGTQPQYDVNFLSAADSFFLFLSFSVFDKNKSAQLPVKSWPFAPLAHLLHLLPLCLQLKDWGSFLCLRARDCLHTREPK